MGVPVVVLEEFAMAEDLGGVVFVEEAALVLHWVDDLEDDLEIGLVLQL